MRVTSIAAKRTSKEIFLVYITVVQFHRAFGDLKSSGKLWCFYDVPLYFVNTVRCVNVLLRVFKQTVIRSVSDVKTCTVYYIHIRIKDNTRYLAESMLDALRCNYNINVKCAYTFSHNNNKTLIASVPATRVHWTCLWRWAFFC